MRVFIFLLSATFLSSCYFTKALKYKKYQLEKLDDFPAVSFPKSPQPFQFHRGSISESIRDELDSLLIGSNRYAFLVIRNDSILYEFYNKGIADTSILPSFSVAKSYVSTMVAMALEEGKIKSLEEPITNYLPELLKRDKRFEKISIQHVLDMRSGIKSSENYFNPTSHVLKLGFGKNLNKKAVRLSIEKEPNQAFEYKSINTQLLAMILERATKRKLQDYFREKIQKPLQFEHTSTWIYDDEKHKTLRAFCCMNLTARDYAKFGRLILNRGNWNGKQLISKEWVDNILNVETRKATDGYKNQWWSNYGVKYFSDSAEAVRYSQNNENTAYDTHHHKEYNSGKWFVNHYGDGIHAQGLIGQYIFVLPQKNMVAVLLSNTLNPNKPLKAGGMGRIKEIVNTKL